MITRTSACIRQHLIYIYIYMYGSRNVYSTHHHQVVYKICVNCGDKPACINVVVSEMLEHFYYKQINPLNAYHIEYKIILYDFLNKSYVDTLISTWNTPGLILSLRNPYKILSPPNDMMLRIKYYRLVCDIYNYIMSSGEKGWDQSRFPCYFWPFIIDIRGLIINAKCHKGGNLLSMWHQKGR